MTPLDFVGGLKAIAAIIGGIVFALSYAAWSMRKTSDQTNQEIDQEIAKEKQKAEETGKPV